MKKFFSVLALITLLLSVYYIGEVSAGANTNSGPLLARQGVARLRFVPRLIRAASKRLRYTIKARYPQAVGVRDPRIAKLNQAIKDLISKEADEFKGYFETPEERVGPVGSYFEADYVVVNASNNIVSIDFAIDTYSEGAAHPNHNSLVLNYDLDTGKMLELANLFKPNSKFLEVISSHSIKSLAQQLGKERDHHWIVSGAGPTEENYKNWNISRKGLKVTFDAYQVASYAEGPHDVIIPYSVLKSVIDPNGPLSGIAGKH